MQTHPVPTCGPFRIVQLSHLRAQRPFDELTAEQRQIQAKQDARTRYLLASRADKADDRRFSGEPITDFGGLA